MDNKKEVTDNPMANLPFSDQIQSIFELDKANSLGFMDMLGPQDYPPSIFDLLRSPFTQPQPQLPPPASTVPESSEVVNTPATLNSPSISSSSSEAANDDQQTKTVEGDQQQDQDKTKKHLMPKKKNTKRAREPRFAFMTKSDVDHLDDGYRWRKYGQKAVKNSSFPRSYYRCTSAGCGVKKRVERSCDDPSIVVTTYEGTHTHPCPLMPRGCIGILPETAGFGGMGGGATSSFLNISQPYYQNHQFPHHQQQQPYLHNPTPTASSSFSSTSTNPSFASVLQDRRFDPSPSPLPLVRDHGLLQDMVPNQMRNDPKRE